MSQNFKKQVEDFICANCGQAVTGSGYTNHCPRCLFSRHVDIHPGDRAAACGSLMKPIAVNWQAGQYVITHRCLNCGIEKTNKAAPADQIGEFLTSML